MTLLNAKATSANPQSRMRGDSPNLDLLRSVAVLLVVISHTPLIQDSMAAYPASIGALGLLGVVIFFVHTSLVLMLSLERQTLAFGAKRRAIIFFIRRTFRIYPLSIAVVLTLTLIVMAFGQHPYIGTTLSNLFLIQNLTGSTSIPGPLWSLPFEIQMYTVIPLLFTFAQKAERKASTLIGAMWCLSVLAILGAWRLGANYHLIKYIPCFLPGILAYTRQYRKPRLHPMILFLYVAPMAVLLPWMVAHGMKPNMLVWPICLVLGLLIPECREVTEPHLKAIGKIIARYSYGIYLVHAPCLDLCFHHLKGVSPWLQYSAFLIAMTFLAFAVYHLIEKPFMAMGSRLVDLCHGEPVSVGS